MGDLRSNTYSRDNRMQIQPYSGGFGGGGGGGRPTVFNQESRSYSAPYATYLDTQPPISVKELKKGKSTNGSSSSKGWGLNDPEFQRKRRVASYKAYSVEGKMKGSFRKSFRWFKDRYYQMIHGW